MWRQYHSGSLNVLIRVPSFIVSYTCVFAFHCELQHDDSAGAGSALHATMSERRTFLIDALWRKFRVQAAATQLAVAAALTPALPLPETVLATGSGEGEEEDGDLDFVRTLKELDKWVNATDIA